MRSPVFSIFGLSLYCCIASSVMAITTVQKEMNKGVQQKDRDGKFFPIFQVVTFPNSACSGNSNRNGTCYTQAECTKKNGKNAGSCASGYGICCTFEKGCGATTTENCTYFTPSITGPGTCDLTVCRCNDNICQLRLDFTSFAIAGPSTESVTFSNALFNNLVSPTVTANGAQISGRPVSRAGLCLTDTFTVTNPGGNAPPVICGNNNMQHMYVDASAACNDLVFQLLSTTATWNIKITQYSCDYNNLAPPGCTQYFFGNSGTGTVQTFNFAGGRHLANQDQTICVRRETGQCRICWIPAATIDFQVSGFLASKGFDNPTQCCQYGPNGMASVTARNFGFDCVEIPVAVKKTVNSALVPSRICGMMLVTINSGTTSMSICSTDTPFLIRFVSDMYENVNLKGPLLEGGTGFKLAYTEDNANC